MIFILLVAFYAFATGRIAFTRRMTLTGPHARVFGFLILVLIFPARWVIHYLLSFAPHGWIDDRLHFAIVNAAFLIAYVAGLAFVCRDREPATAS